MQDINAAVGVYYKQIVDLNYSIEMQRSQIEEEYRPKIHAMTEEIAQLKSEC